MVGVLMVVPTHNKDGKVPRGGIGRLGKGPLVYCDVSTTHRLAASRGVYISASSSIVVGIMRSCNLGIRFGHPTRLTASYTKAGKMLLRTLRFCRGRNHGCSMMILLRPASPFHRAGSLGRTITLCASSVSVIISIGRTTAGPCCGDFRRSTRNLLIVDGKSNAVRQHRSTPGM